MRKLTREYGWSAAGVYFTLSVLDIPLCYLLVKTLGTERISEYVSVSAFGRTVQSLGSIVSTDSGRCLNVPEFAFRVYFE